jgi:hypothetical protein
MQQDHHFQDQSSLSSSALISSRLNTVHETKKQYSAERDLLGHNVFGFQDL